jgi:hypothetical protein
MGCSFYRRERNHLSATDAWREDVVGDPPYMCIRTASFECSVSKQIVVKTDQPDDSICRLRVLCGRPLRDKCFDGRLGELVGCGHMSGLLMRRM